MGKRAKPQQDDLSLAQGLGGAMADSEAQPKPAKLRLKLKLDGYKFKVKRIVHYEAAHAIMAIFLDGDAPAK